MASTQITTQDSGIRLMLPPCRVCGDRAAGFHYGVNTCEACKGFFHRSLRRYKEYKCRANRMSGFCEYKPGKRKSCQYCRYQRCLNAGMSKDAIKTGRYTYLKRTEDTQEIKRLEDLEHQICSGGHDVNTKLMTSSFNSLTHKKCDTAKLTRIDFNSHTLMDVDSTTTEEFLTPSVTESDLSCSSSDFSTTETHPVNSSLLLEHRNQHNYGKLNNNCCQRNQAQSAKEDMISSKENSVNQSDLSTYGHMKYPNQSLTSIGVDLSASPDSYSDESQNFILLYASETDVTSHLVTDDSALESYNIKEVCDEIQSKGSSVIHNLLSKTKAGNINDHAQKNNTECMELYKNMECKDFTTDSSTDTDSASQSADALNSNRNHVLINESSMSKSVLLYKKNVSKSDSTDLIGPTFDLFPDISFCLDGRPITSPASLMSEDVEPTSILLSSVTSQSSGSSNNSPAPSSGMIMLNMDSGKRLKVSDECDLVADLCHTPESRYPIGEDNLVHNEDNITLQIMEEYTKGLDLIVDSPVQTQISAQTPVQALLTSPSPQELRSISPLSSTGSDFDYLNESSLTSKLLNSVKSLKISDILELYSDMDAVISVLMSSHKENIRDFSFLSKEEMTAQQKAHRESCQLRQQTFGDLGLLPEQEYDDIYSITGIDVDNRRMIIQKYLARMERCVRGLVQFAKTIPGFSILDINTQVELIKLARSEFAIFTVYPTVNLELGVSLGLTGEQWACQYDMGKVGLHLEEYMIFCDRLQKMSPTQEEEILMKAILVVSSDRDTSTSSPLADAIRWQLILCLEHILEKHRDQPSLFLARYIHILTQLRTVADKFKEFFRQLKMHKYSSIEQNPLLWELYSGILQEKKGEENWDKLYQLVGEGVAGMWSPCLMG